MIKKIVFCSRRRVFMDIIEKIKNGDETPLLELYKLYRDEFIAWAFKKYAADRDTAKDIFQDVIITFYENVKEGKITSATSSIKTYLFAIGKFKLINAIKRNGRIGYVSDPGLINGNEPNHSHMDNQDEKEFIRDTVSKYLDQQPEDCQKILRMYYFDGLSMEQIAHKMGYKNADVAKSKKAKCFKCLAEQVKKGLMMLVLFM